MNFQPYLGFIKPYFDVCLSSFIVINFNFWFGLKSRIWNFRYWRVRDFEKKLTNMSGNPFFEQILVFSKTRLLKSWQNCFYPIRKKIIFLESLSDALNTIFEKKLTWVNLSLFFFSIFDFSRKPLSSQHLASQTSRFLWCTYIRKFEFRIWLKIQDLCFK